MMHFQEVRNGMQYQCDICGCLTVDTDLHGKWHRLPIIEGEQL